MLSGMLALLLNSAFLMLRLGGSGGSFPRPLSAEEERKYLLLAAEGDEEARAVLIEHNLEMLKSCDYLIELGPSGGNKGGKVIFSGTPKEMLSCENSVTAPYFYQV